MIGRPQIGKTKRHNNVSKPCAVPEGIKAQRLKRVFDIDVETCARCGGQVRVIACIEESLPRERRECFGYPVVIQKILDHEKSKQETLGFGSTVLARGPPQERLLD